MAQYRQSFCHILLLSLFVLCYVGYTGQQSDNYAKSNEQSVTAAPANLFSFDDATFYKINWISASNDNNSQDYVPFKAEEGEEIVLASSNKEKYRCVIPNVDTKSKYDLDSSKDEELNPYQLMKPAFSKKLCSYRVENYWTYEICHGRYIRQYHEDQRSRGSVQEYYLGKFNLEDLSIYIKNYNENEKGKSRPVINVEDLQLPYVEINMTDGTLCDLSNKKRFTRVLYVCIEESNFDFYSIKETSTCEYEVITFSPYLCQSPEFKLKTPTEHEIKCYPLNAQSPIIPKGYELIDIQNQVKARKSAQESESLKPESLFEGKSILIESNGKNLRINVLPEPDSLTSITAQFLKGEYCLSGGSGWWKYEFCYGKKVDQFHEENGKRMTINLGNWDLKEHIKWLEANPSKRPKQGKTPKQVSHFYSYGEACDLTKKPRTVEVKLKCPKSNTSPLEAVTIYLMEPETCEYVLGVESAIICDLLSSVDEVGLFRDPIFGHDADDE